MTRRRRREVPRASRPAGRAGPSPAAATDSETARQGGRAVSGRRDTAMWLWVRHAASGLYLGRTSGEGLSSPRRETVSWLTGQSGVRDVTERSRVPLRAVARVRLDTLLAERGLFSSRTRAAASVMAGEVRIGGNGQRAQKPGPDGRSGRRGCRRRAPALRLARRRQARQRAGRRSASTRPGARCLDVGASTGGFTDCLLQARRARTSSRSTSPTASSTGGCATTRA